MTSSCKSFALDARNQFNNSQQSAASHTTEHEGSKQPAQTLSNTGIRPAVKITATAPAGRTHPGASTVPGSATPLLASSGTTEVCSTVVTAETAAGRGDAIAVVQEAPARPLAMMRTLGGATTKASATGARHRRESTAESFMALVLLRCEHTFSSCNVHLNRTKVLYGYGGFLPEVLRG